MCAEYQLTVSNRKIQQALGVPLPESGPTRFDPSKRVKFTAPAPVILLDSSGRAALEEKVFPVNPFPNARLSGFASGEEGSAETDEDIRRIYDVPLWKSSFSNHPVLVPMTDFFEPVYWGKDVGTVQKFRVPDEPVFFVAGLLIKPRVPKSDSLSGFALITHTATPQMLHYHQRLVAILKPSQAAEYLSPMKAQERFQFLIENRYTGPLDVEKDRTMAKGWEKKVSQAEGKLHREQSYLKALKRESVLG